ncbi:MAG: hypothetical protein ACRD1X_07915 [Vicinamibacteria bacterium]
MLHFDQKKTYLRLAASALLLTAVFALNTSRAQLVILLSRNASSTPPTPEPSPQPDLSALLRAASSTPRSVEWTPTPQYTAPARRHSKQNIATRVGVIEVGGEQLIAVLRGSSGDQVLGSDDSISGNARQKPFLSPDGKLLSLTSSPVRSHSSVTTSLVGADGNEIVAPRVGSFLSWLPDSSGALLYLSEFDHKEGKKIFVLDKDGRYYDLGLPVWTYSADVSPTDGTIVFSRANEYTDASNLWLRKNGQDSPLVRGDDEIFAWLRWSPTGDKIAFLRSKIGAKTPDEARQLWVVNPDGTGATKIAGNVLWAYPPVWSPDGRKLLIAVNENGGANSIAVDYETLESNISEFEIASQLLRKLASFHGARALYPSYSGDGGSVVFVADQSGVDEVWRIKGGKLEQLTNDGTPKQYPILP